MDCKCLLHLAPEQEEALEKLSGMVEAQQAAIEQMDEVTGVKVAVARE